MVSTYLWNLFAKRRLVVWTMLKIGSLFQFDGARREVVAEETFRRRHVEVLQRVSDGDQPHAQPHDAVLQRSLPHAEGPQGCLQETSRYFLAWFVSVRPFYSYHWQILPCSNIPSFKSYCWEVKTLHLNKSEWTLANFIATSDTWLISLLHAAGCQILTFLAKDWVSRRYLVCAIYFQLACLTEWRLNQVLKRPL